MPEALTRNQVGVVSLHEDASGVANEMQRIVLGDSNQFETKFGYNEEKDTVFVRYSFNFGGQWFTAGIQTHATPDLLKWLKAATKIKPNKE